MSKIPGPPVGYTDLIDQVIMDDENAITTREYSPIRPSSAGKCTQALRNEYEEYSGKVSYQGETKPPNVVRLLSLGNSVEFSALQFFAKLKKSFGIDVKYKQQVVTVGVLADGTRIEGSCDMALVGPGWKCVADVKSFKDAFHKAYGTRLDDTLAKYDRLRSLVKLSDTAWYAPDPVAFLEEIGYDDYLCDNILQLNLYLMSDFFQEREFDHGSIYKYSKNCSRHYELRFPPSQALKDMALAKFSAAITGENVKKDFNLGSMRCSFCPYNSRCYPDGDAKKAYFATWPKKEWPTDLDKLPAEVGALLTKYNELEDENNEKTKLENKITKLCWDLGVKKIRLSPDHIYEIKLLKSPREHLELRRGKV